MTTALITNPTPNAMPAWLGSIAGTLEQARPVAELLSKSGMVPQAFSGKPEAILIAGAMGARLGLDLFSALSGIAVVNGRPTLWGDAMLAVCQQRSDWQGMEVSWAGDGDKLACTVTVARKGQPPYSATFSVAEAKTANLWGKQGPWTNYPRRMLELRARAFALRGSFADALAGFHSKEEMDDAELKEVEATVHAEPKPARKRSAPSNAQPSGSGASAGEGVVAAPAAEGSATTPSNPAAGDPPQEPAPTTASVEDCRKVLNELWALPGGKEKVKALLADAKIAKVDELAGDSPEGRLGFVDTVRAAINVLRNGVAQ